jgi:hypothetical protein
MKISDPEFKFSGDFNVTILPDGTITSENFADLVRRQTAGDVADASAEADASTIDGCIKKSEDVALEAAR